MTIPWLDPTCVEFPPTYQALEEPNGLLAAGGALTPEWLLSAYQRGIFPWYNQGDPILWWSPAPRMVIYPDQLHVSRSLRKAIKKLDITVTMNRDFNGVITACSDPRSEPIDQNAGHTWISSEMVQAYNRLHRLNYAHSVEVWSKGELVGGLYGVALGSVFFGESMFSRMTNASKIALSYLSHYLVGLNFKLIDCQVYNDHLASLGGVQISREAFENKLTQSIATPTSTDFQHDWSAKTLLSPL